MSPARTFNFLHDWTKTVRQGVVILALCLALLGGAVASLKFVPHTVLYEAGAVRLDRVACLGCVLLAALCALLGMFALRAGCRNLARQVTALQVGARGALLECPHGDLARLTAALNDLVDDARGSVERAMLQVKELEIQLKVATAERQHAEAIIYSISDAVLVTDPFDELVLANESAARAFDFNLEQSARTPVSGILKDQKMIEMIQEMRQSNSKSGRRIVEHHVRTAVGERTFKVTLSCVAEQQHQGEPTGVVAVLHDMTKEKEVAEMKNDFVSSVSHELRTPLASIKAYIEMLIDG